MVNPGIYRHMQSGKLYKVLNVGKCSESLQEKIVYQALYENNDIWVRPAEMWTADRFEPFSLSQLEYYFDKIALLYINDRKVLMARSKGKKNFYMPGGKREAGESDTECLVRECREELGVEVDPSSVFLYGVYSAFAYADKPCAQLKMYFANFKGTPAPSSEIEEIGWIGYKDRDKAIGSGRTLLDELYWKGLID